MYNKFRGNNNLKGVREATYHIGIRQHDRHLEGDMPNEMRRGPKHAKIFAPALWRLKRTKREGKDVNPEPFTELREGVFYVHDLYALRLQMLRKGKAPTVMLKHPTKISALAWRVGNHKNCVVRERAEVRGHLGSLS